MADIRSVKTIRKTLINQAAVTTLKITTSTLSETIDMTGYATGVFVTSVMVNSTFAPAVYLDVRVDTTNWMQYATMHPDMTTTANAYLVNVSNFPNDVRVRVNPLTTTTYTQFNVKAEIFSK